MTSTVEGGGPYSDFQGLELRLANIHAHTLGSSSVLSVLTSHNAELEEAQYTEAMRAVTGSKAVSRPTTLSSEVITECWRDWLVN